MNKTYIQSRTQNLYYRMYSGAVHIFGFSLAAVLLALFTHSTFPNLSSSLFTVVVIAAIGTLWLMIFNSGKSKVIEHGIEINDEGISYLHYANKQTILWVNFNGFSCTGKLPRLVKLSNLDGENIVFNYYVFSSKQRTEIFDYLNIQSSL